MLAPELSVIAWCCQSHSSLSRAAASYLAPMCPLFILAAKFRWIRFTSRDTSAAPGPNLICNSCQLSVVRVYNVWCFASQLTRCASGHSVSKTCGWRAGTMGMKSTNLLQPPHAFHNSYHAACWKRMLYEFQFPTYTDVSWGFCAGFCGGQIDKAVIHVV